MKKFAIFIIFGIFSCICLFPQNMMLGNQLQYQLSGNDTRSDLTVTNLRTNFVLAIRVQHKGADFYSISCSSSTGNYGTLGTNQELYSKEFIDVLANLIIERGDNRQDQIWDQYANEFANMLVRHIQSYRTPSPPQTPTRPQYNAPERYGNPTPIWIYNSSGLNIVKIEASYNGRVIDIFKYTRDNTINKPSALFNYHYSLFAFPSPGNYAITIYDIYGYAKYYFISVQNVAYGAHNYSSVDLK